MNKQKKLFKFAKDLEVGDTILLNLTKQGQIRVVTEVKQEGEFVHIGVDNDTPSIVHHEAVVVMG